VVISRTIGHSPRLRNPQVHYRIHKRPKLSSDFWTMTFCNLVVYRESRGSTLVTIYHTRPYDVVIFTIAKAPNLTHFNPVHTLMQYFPKINYNSIILAISRPHKSLFKGLPINVLYLANSSSWTHYSCLFSRNSKKARGNVHPNHYARRHITL
jgi:hypothetical protein